MSKITYRRNQNFRVLQKELRIIQGVPQFSIDFEIQSLINDTYEDEDLVIDIIDYSIVNFEAGNVLLLVTVAIEDLTS